MVRLDTFRTEARTVRGNARIALTHKSAGVAAQSGRIARWIGRFRKSDNRKVIGAFIASLRDQYGGELTDQLVRSTGMDREMALGKPLRARQVRKVAGRADALSAAVAERNSSVAAGYARKLGSESDLSLVKISLEHQSRTLYPANPNMHLLVDPARVSGMVQREIIAAGDKGKHFVTTEEAAEILKRVVNGELDAAFTSARQGALGKMSIEESSSVSRYALSAAIAGPEWASNIDPDRFETDLNDMLRTEIEEAVHNRLQAPAIDDDAALHALAGELMEGFVAERAAVREAVEGLPLDTETKGKILDQALHDNIRADMIPAMGRAYLEVRDDLPALGESLGPAGSREPLSRVCDAMTAAIRESGVEVSVENQDAIYRSFWRFLLAPGGNEQAGVIAGRMEDPESAMRSVAAGAAWLRLEFPQTEEGLRTEADKNGRERLTYADTIHTASRYATMMENLAKVLRDKTDAPAESFGLSGEDERLISREPRSDEAIADLRNVGIGMPAPDRIGAANPDAPVSRPALDLIRAGIDTHLEKCADKEVTGGILDECAVDLARCTFRIDGRTMTRDADVVADGLRAFCTDSSGHLNEHMLLGISKVAYQVAFGPVYDALFHPGRNETSLFAHLPVVQREASSVEYNVLRNERGEPALRAVLHAACDTAVRLTDNGPERTVLDTNRSQVDLTVDYAFDANDFTPTVEGVKVGYALFPDRAPPDADGSRPNA